MTKDFRIAHGQARAEEQTEAPDVGRRLRELRKMYGFSQRQLAKRAGVTNGTISLVEQERISPSIGSLKKILDGFPINMTDFLTLDMAPNRQVFYTSKDQKEIAGGDPISFKLLGKDTRGRAIQMMHETYKAGADTGEEMLAHSGEECGIVISGELVLTVGGETRLLLAGEAYYFDSRLPHRFRNLGKDECVIVSACTPPSF
ncbi:MAG: XRE family transcriptional regulator [Rhodobiaceae bacterium]|nr:MAG: XRE family transcriptional regulator [Rhodobiaceae bacterium]